MREPHRSAQLRRRRAERIALLLPRLGVPFSDRVAQDVCSQQRRPAAAPPSSRPATRPSGWTGSMREIEGGLADGVIADWRHLSEAEVVQFADRLSRRQAARGGVPSVGGAGGLLRRPPAPPRLSGWPSTICTRPAHRRIAYMLHDKAAEGSRLAAYRRFTGGARHLPSEPSSWSAVRRRARPPSPMPGRSRRSSAAASGAVRRVGPRRRHRHSRLRGNGAVRPRRHRR